MSDPFDPIEDWLGTDIELLPPPGGAFEQVHRRARRRKTVVAMTAAAGAAVAIAAAATLPQLASALQSGQGTPDRFKPAASSSQSSQPGHHKPVSPTPSRSPKAGHGSAGQTGSHQSITSANLPPTAGISPSSITFVNDGAVGAVIGETTTGCPAGCEAVAATPDYGQSWFMADAPPAGPPNGDSGVSQIRFLEPRNGWAYGPGLFVTHDGGTTWIKASGVSGRVIDLATVNGSAYAVVASCTGTGTDFASGCTSFALYTSPYYSNAFQPVAGASGKGLVEPGGLQLTNGNGYLLAGHTLYSGSPSGGPWQAVTISSGTVRVPACLAARGHSVAPGESGLLAPSATSEVYLLCQPAGGGGGSLYTSTDAGASWQPDGQVKAQGTGTSLAVAPGSGTLVLATSSGIYYSPDAHHWHRAGLSVQSVQAPANGFSYVGMTTQQNGVAMPADPTSRSIYVTNDGGLTWHPKRITGATS